MKNICAVAASDSWTDPDGFRVMEAHFGPVTDAIVVGDSWVDGVAAAKAGIPFVAYRARVSLSFKYDG